MTVFLHLESIPVDRLPKKIFKMVKPEKFFSRIFEIFAQQRVAFWPLQGDFRRFSKNENFERGRQELSPAPGVGL